MKLNLEVRNNPLVALWTVYVEGLGILNQAVFTNVKAGVFTYSQNITPTGPSLLVRFTIVGQGATVLQPAGVCLVSFGDAPSATPPAPSPAPSYLKPYLIAAITAGNTTDTEEYHYPVGSGASSTAQIPGFDQL
jgi:hypothetical protein